MPKKVRSFADVSGTIAFAKALELAIHEYDSDHGFAVTQTTLRKAGKMDVLVVTLDNGTEFNCIIEQARRVRK